MNSSMGSANKNGPSKSSLLTGFYFWMERWVYFVRNSVTGKEALVGQVAVQFATEPANFEALVCECSICTNLSACLRKALVSFQSVPAAVNAGKRWCVSGATSNMKFILWTRRCRRPAQTKNRSHLTMIAGWAKRLCRLVAKVVCLQVSNHKIK